MRVQPYLYFNGRCAEAMEFYTAALGAQVKMAMKFKQAPDQSMIRPDMGEKIMHGQLDVGPSSILVSDGHCDTTQKFGSFAMTLTADSAGDAEELFGKLADGGNVFMPMAKTFFAERFGMVTDRFGVLWNVMTGA